MLLGREGSLRRRPLGAFAPAAASGAAREGATGSGVDSLRKISPRVAGPVALRRLRGVPMEECD